MASAAHRPESWIGRLCLCWALLLASLAFVGLATPASAAARPAVEYSAPGRTAPAAIARQVRRTALSPNRPDADDAAAPVFGTRAPEQPRQTRDRAYEATGPPLG